MRPTLKFKDWILEMGTGFTSAIVGSCKGGPDFQVQGACSDVKPKKKQKAITGKSVK